MASWVVARTVGTLLTRTTARQRPDNKLKKLRSFVAARLEFNARGRVPAELNAVFPPWDAVLLYPSNPSHRSNPSSKNPRGVPSGGWVGSRRTRVEEFERPFDGCHEFNEAPRRQVRSVVQAGFVESHSFVEFVITRSPGASRAALRRISLDEFGNGFYRFDRFNEETTQRGKQVLWPLTRPSG
jgi:hypothetical protein